MAARWWRCSTLANPVDESIDLTPQEAQAAKELTLANWEKSTKARKSNEPPTRPNGLEARQFRNKSRGLLLLYPIDPRPAGLPEETPVIGFAFSFPKSDTATEVTYTVNNVFAGLLFEGVTVQKPGDIALSPEHVNGTASGVSAASSFGAKISFTRPVVQVTVKVLPCNLAVNAASGYLPVYLKAYTRSGPLVVAAAPVIFSVRTSDELRYFRPTTISVSSSSPIDYVTIDLGEEWRNDGTRFLFDDLELTIVEPPIPPPPLTIQRMDAQLNITLPDGVATPRLEYTTDLNSGWWYEWSSFVVDPSALRTQGINSMFFRAR